MTDPAAQGATGSSPGEFLLHPPRFFSGAFHFQFLPKVLGYRVGQFWRKDRNQHRHVHMEMPIVIVFCCVLVATGLPAVLDHRSILGGLATLIGGGGLATLASYSVIGEYLARRSEGYRYDYAVFMPSMFFFCLVGGAFAGLMIGFTLDNAFSAGLSGGLFGLVVGYLIGPFAARWVHALGFLTEWVLFVAIFCTLVMAGGMIIGLIAAWPRSDVWTGGPS